MWRFPNGSRLRFAYLERDADADAYTGHSYSRLYVEEIGTFPDPKPIFKLMATLRSGAGVPVGFRATGNPGHQWVKARYIDPSPGGMSVIVDETTGLQRIYIPSKVSDNKYLGDDYVQRLKASGGEALAYQQTFIPPVSDLTFHAGSHGPPVLDCFPRGPSATPARRLAGHRQDGGSKSQGGGVLAVW